MRDNLLLDTDSYKLSHFMQYPPNTSYMFSYLESRGGKYSKTLFFGLQPILSRLAQGFTQEDIDEAVAFSTAHGEPFNKAGWDAMLLKHGGKFPIRIAAVPEGTLVPTHNILLSAESTDPEFFWIVSYLETMIMRVWYPITVATRSRTIKTIIHQFLQETAEDPDAEINFKLHDFGSRGVSSHESAEIGGAAHLVNFMGSDTIPGIRFANFHYYCPMAGFSIPAAEHSTMTMWGRGREKDAYENMIEQYGEGALYAVVSDSYDIDNAVRNLWGKELKGKVLSHPGVLVVRPDSGVPHKVVLSVLQGLDEAFGSSYNSKGFKVLNHVRVIQGDGIDEDSIREILTTAKNAGFSATNIAFGMGGALLQKVDRDTQNFAFKCSAAKVDGEMIDVSKAPKHQAMKASKPGVMTLVKKNGSYETVRGTADSFGSALKVVFEDGVVTKTYTLSEVRARSLEG